MRYYAIKITDSNGDLVTTPSSVPGSGFTYTSFANNRSIPGALQIELDIPLAAYGTPVKGGIVAIWGVSLQEISAATQLGPTQDTQGILQYKSIAIYGGFQKGLPLANPEQNGLLIEGSILQAYGNWIGTDQNIELIIAPEIGSNASPKNISLNWYAGQPFAEAIRNTLKIAFPKFKEPVINISDKLVVSFDQPAFYNTIEQFAVYVKNASISILGGDFTGVDIAIRNNTFYVSDQSKQADPKQIAFQDLIGQPTWIEGLTLQFKCPMRADIGIFDYVKMPKAIVTTTVAAPSALINLKSAFQGTFFVKMVRHCGSFRQPDGASWVTNFDAVFIDQGAQANQEDF